MPQQTPIKTYSQVFKIPPGQGRRDYKVYSLRYVCMRGSGPNGKLGYYAQFLFKSPVTGKHDTISLGKLMRQAGLAPDQLGGGVLTATLEPVREKAAKLDAKVRAGIDPRIDADITGLTLRQARDLHIQSMRNAVRSERSITDLIKFTDLYLGDWLALALRKISKAMIRERHSKISKRGKHAANHAMRWLRALWNEARGVDDELMPWPTKAFTPHRFKAKKSAIPPEQYPQWFSEVARVKNELRRDVYLLGVMTGLRRGSLLSIELQHINRAKRTVLIPLPKSGEPFTLPLSDLAFAVVQRRARASSSKYLFPAARGDGHTTITPKHDGFTLEFSLHDLRRMYHSAATEAEIHPYILKLLVDHALDEKDVTAGYVKVSDKKLAEAQQRITDYFKERGLTETVG